MFEMLNARPADSFERVQKGLDIDKIAYSR